MKINMASFFKDAIPQSTFDCVLPDAQTVTPTDVMLDRIAGSIPWASWGDRILHRLETDKRKGKEICNRLSMFYGFEWWHSNIACETHEGIANLMGVVNLETVRQIYFILYRRRLTTRSGDNEYVKDANFNQYWKFPTLFGHGADSQLYDPVSALNSCLRLRELRKLNGGNGNPPAYGAYWFEAPDCGHMDFLFGKNANETIYPYLDAFFQQAQGRPLECRLKKAWKQIVDAEPDSARDPYWDLQKTPVCGPIIGWAHKCGKDVKLRLWVEPFLFSAFDPHGTIINHSGLLITPMPLPVNPVYPGRVAHAPGTDPDDPGTIPNYPGTYWVYDVTVPPEFARDKDLQISIDYSGRGDIRFKVDVVQTQPLEGRNHELHDPEKGVRIPLSALPWFQRMRQEQDSDHVAFLVCSCRYPGSPFDENLADSIFQPMLGHVDDSRSVTHNASAKDIDHVLLIGDQIYADATADIFDTRELREHFTRPYREAFGARHMRRLMASVPTYMAIDDHEFEDNWPGNASMLLVPSNPDPVVQRYMNIFWNGLAAVWAYQWSMSPRNAPPQPTPPATTNDLGLWYTYESGGLPFFVMDTRTERDLRQDDISVHQANVVGPRQLQALKAWLLKPENQDKPKFIISGTVLAPAAKDFVQKKWLYRNSDSWWGYPATWQELVHHIVKHNIKRVVFIAGDYHLSTLAKLTLSSNVASTQVRAYSIVASAYFAPLPFANSHPDDYQWGSAGRALPFSAPLPFAATHPPSPPQARIDVEPYLLCTRSRHFLRVDAKPQADSKWVIALSVWNCAGVVAPEMAVEPPFILGPDNVIRWDI